VTTQMAAEIAAQPAAVADTLTALMPLRSDLRALAGGRRRVLFAARGSSDNAAIYGRYVLETHAGVSAALASPSLATHYRASLDLDDALMVCVSQSGSTAEIVETAEWARRCGAVVVGITNAADSELARISDVPLVTQAGPEYAVPATKSYLAQLAAMAVLGTALAPEPTSLDEQLARVPEQIARLLGEPAGAAEAVAALAEARYTVVSGRGLLMGTALEVALKLEETCLRPVRGYSYADLRHGPISVVADGVVAVLVAAQDGPLAGAMAELAADLDARGAATIGIGGDPAFARACGVHLAGPDLPEVLAPFGAVVPGQIVVERLARTWGLDPDNPRGLSKVTQTDR
jgi:glucosamine--fructose-6-phosphate aminotransferase (isomerizing)